MATIRCPVNETGAISRHEPAFIFKDRKIIYYEYDQCVTATAERLLEAGCVKGERAAILLPNQWEYAALVMALFRVGAIACPLNSELTGNDPAEVIKELKCARLITNPDLISRGNGFPVPIHYLNEVIAASPRDVREEVPVLDLNQDATIVMMSGRSGKPKAVLHTIGNHYYSAKGANHNTHTSSGSRWLLSHPLDQMNGLTLMIRCVVSGSALVIPDSKESLDEAIINYEVTHLLLESEQWTTGVRTGVHAGRYPKLRAVLLCGGAMEANHLEVPHDGIAVVTSYGLAETASEVTAMRPDAPAAKRDSVGRVLKYRDIRIAQDGEILVRGPTLFKGYVENGSVRSALDSEGWFATGDQGRMDEEGYLTVVGRKREAVGST